MLAKAVMMLDGSLIVTSVTRRITIPAVFFVKLSVKIGNNSGKPFINQIKLRRSNIENINREAGIPVKLYFVTVLNEFIVIDIIYCLRLYSRFGNVFCKNIMKRIDTVKRLKIVKGYLKYAGIFFSA